MNNAEFITQLCYKYRERIYIFLCHYCYDSQAAEDILQETYLEALKKADTLQAHPDIKGWLFRTAHNKALNANKQAQRKLRQLCLDDCPDDIKICVREDKEDSVMDIKDIISDEEFLLLWRLYVDKYTYPELEQVYKIPVNTLKSKVRRIKMKITGLYLSTE